MQVGILVLAQICDAGNILFHWFSDGSVSLAIEPTESSCF